MKNIKTFETLNEFLKYLISNYKLTLLVFIVLSIAYTGTYFISSSPEFTEQGGFVAWGEIASILIRFSLPFFLICYYFETKYNKNKNIIKSFLFIPFRFKTYFYTILLTLSIVIPVFIGIQLIPQSFIDEAQEVGITLIEFNQAIEQGSIKPEIAEEEIAQSIEQLKESIPYFQIFISSLLSISLFLLLFSIFIFTLPMMFSDNDKGAFSNVKTSFLMFLNNAKSLLILNFIILMFFVLLQILDFGDGAKVLQNSFSMTVFIVYIIFLYRNNEIKEQQVPNNPKIFK